MLTSWFVELSARWFSDKFCTAEERRPLLTCSEKALAISAFICVHLRFTKTALRSVAAAPRSVHPRFNFFSSNRILSRHIHTSSLLNRLQHREGQCHALACLFVGQRMGRSAAQERNPRGHLLGVALPVKAALRLLAPAADDEFLKVGQFGNDSPPINGALLLGPRRVAFTG